MPYAKLISTTAVNTVLPRTVRKDGRIYAGDITAVPGLPESAGYYPLSETPAPEPREGYHAEPRYAYDDDASPTRIDQTWVEVEDPPPPPRSLSKRRLYDALNAVGLWDQAQAYMEASGSWMVFSLATTLDEDDPLIVSAITALKTTLGLTDEQVESILAASVAG